MFVLFHCGQADSFRSTSMFSIWQFQTLTRHYVFKCTFCAQIFQVPVQKENEWWRLVKLPELYRFWTEALFEWLLFHSSSNLPSWAYYFPWFSEIPWRLFRSYVSVWISGSLRRRNQSRTFSMLYRDLDVHFLRSLGWMCLKTFLHSAEESDRLPVSFFVISRPGSIASWSSSQTCARSVECASTTTCRLLGVTSVRWSRTTKHASLDAAVKFWHRLPRRFDSCSGTCSLVLSFGVLFSLFFRVALEKANDLVWFEIPVSSSALDLLILLISTDAWGVCCAVLSW